MRITSFMIAAAVALIPFRAVAQSPPSKPAFALPPESITVVATKPSDATIRNFVETRATPTRVLHKIAQWRRPI
jgi:hypothetical protein